MVKTCEQRFVQARNCSNRPQLPVMTEGGLFGETEKNQLLQWVVFSPNKETKYEQMEGRELTKLTVC